MEKGEKDERTRIISLLSWVSRLVFDNDQGSFNFGLVFSNKVSQTPCNVEDTPDASGKSRDLVVILVNSPLFTIL